jgi:alpha-ribazole phosphatase/probable phosphoglycerate mutase
MTRLFLIRHGNTIDDDTKPVYKGRIDIPLSKKGASRMRGAAAFLSAFKLDRLYTSTLSRSLESGRIIAEAQGLDVEPTHAFDEIDFGVWEGMSFNEIMEQYPEELRTWLADPGVNPPPEGEPFRAARARAMRGLKKIIAGHTGKNIGIVAHAGILRIMIFSLLDMRLRKIFRMGQGYGAINIINIHDDGRTVADLLNFTYYPF